jgi:hypothetical protein
METGSLGFSPADRAGWKDADERRDGGGARLIAWLIDRLID